MINQKNCILHHLWDKKEFSKHIVLLDSYFNASVVYYSCWNLPINNLLLTGHILKMGYIYMLIRYADIELRDTCSMQFNIVKHL